MVLPQDVLLLAGFDGFTAANSVGCDHFPGDEIYPRISGSAITRGLYEEKQNGWQLTRHGSEIHGIPRTQDWLDAIGFRVMKTPVVNE